MGRLLPSTLIVCAVATVALALLPGGTAQARSPIRVGVGDQNLAMFISPAFRPLNIRRTRYFVASDVMRDAAERRKARAFVEAASAAGVSTLLHISTTDLRSKRGALVSMDRYQRDVGRIVDYFRKLGVTDFGAWNEVNHTTQETWDHPGHAASYFKSMYRAVKQGEGPPAACPDCAVVGLDVLDQAGVEGYIRRFYEELSPTWRKRLTVVGIHNYVDVNRNRTTGTSSIIRTVHRYNPDAGFWFTETGALASFRGSFPFSLTRQAARMPNMFRLASRFRGSGVTRVYSYNWFGVETDTRCGRTCEFDAGLVNPLGSLRPVYGVFRRYLRDYSR
jgi:hypothetical protein